MNNPWKEDVEQMIRAYAYYYNKKIEDVSISDIKENYQRAMNDAVRTAERHLRFLEIIRNYERKEGEE